MKFNNEENTKELSFGEANSATPISTSENTTPTPQPEGNTNGESNKATFIESTPAPKAAEASKPTQTVKPEGSNGGGNSFYDRQQNNSASTKWTKDWRGKTLGLSLAALILIGVGIPSGMAMAGYWRDNEFGHILDNTEVDTAIDLTSDEIERIYDQALLDHYESLVYEGYITETAHKRKIDDAEEAANDTIDNEKETLKANYGNTWEEEWDNELKKKGFHTAANGGEQEYKDSMISATIEESIKTKYTTKGALTSTTVSDDGSYDYISSAANTKGKYYFIENMFPAFYTTGKTWDNIVDSEGEAVSYSYTPEDLINLYILTYEPIVFNNSLLPFTPVNGANDTTADIQGDNVYMTNDNVKAAWSFARVAADTDPAAKNYGGIQTKYGVDFASQSLGTEANIAVNLAMTTSKDEVTSSFVVDGKDTTITSIVDAGFAAVENLGGKTSETVTSTDITNMNSFDVQQFSKGISDALKAAGLLTSEDEDGTVTKRNFATTGIFTTTEHVDETTTISYPTVSFVSSNGLNNIGISYKNEQIVNEQLDNYAGVKNSLDLGLVTSFNTWFASSFKYISIIDFLSNPTNPTDGWFNITTTDGNITDVTLNLKYDTTVTAGIYEDITDTVNELDNIADEDKDATIKKIAAMVPYVLFKDMVLATTNGITESYNSAKTFVETNWQDYNADEFETGIGADLTTYLSGSMKAGFAKGYFNGILDLMTSTEMKTKNEVINKGGDE